MPEVRRPAAATAPYTVTLGSARSRPEPARSARPEAASRGPGRGRRLRMVTPGRTRQRPSLAGRPQDRPGHWLMQWLPRSVVHVPRRCLSPPGRAVSRPGTQPGPVVMKLMEATVHGELEISDVVLQCYGFCTFVTFCRNLDTC
jgi:hypothetical protein